MKAKVGVLFTLIIVLVLSLKGALAAQGPGTATSSFPPEKPGLRQTSSPEEPELDRSVTLPQLQTEGIQSTDVISVPLGQPGLSFRHVETLGETEVPYLADTTHVNFPWGIGTDGVNVWIGESFGRRALKFTSTGSFVTSLGTAGLYVGENTFFWIADIAIDNSSKVWIVDGNSQQVFEYDQAGNFVSELGTGEMGSANNQFNMPAGIAFDSTGNVYISDGGQWWSSDVGNHRVQIFDSDGKYLNTIGTTGTASSGNTQFHGPRHIAIYENQLYVADSGNHRVQIFDVSNPNSPVYVATIGVSGEASSDNAHLSNPSGVAVDSGFIYVADTWNHRVQIYDRSTRTYVATHS